MKTKRSVSCLVMACLLITAAHANATVWDLNTDMNASINDNGIWSYGYAVGDPNDPNAIPPYEALMDPYEVPGIWIKIFPDGINPPHIWYGSGGVGVPEGWHGMKPGWKKFGPAEDAAAAQAPAVIRWTAPDSFVTADSITIDATIYLPQGGLVDVFIVKSLAGDPNQRTILLEERDAEPNSIDPVTFLTTTLSVTTGDTIDFMVGPHGPENLGGTDWNAVSITISDSCTTQLPMDFNWDCYVNLEDLAIMAGDWLTCNDPQGPNCTPPIVPTVLRVDFNGYYSYNEPNNALWTYEGPGLLGSGTFWNGLEVSYLTPNTISAIYPGPGLLLDDGVTDSGITITLAGNEYGDRADSSPDKLLADYLLGYHPGMMPPDPNIIITISGLIPGNSYRLAGYGDNAGGNVGGIWTANGVGPLDLTAETGTDNGILENVIADEKGQIVVEIAEDPIGNLHYTVVNGLELEGTFTATPVRSCQSNDVYEEFDFNEDCYVNLGDFADFAQSWLDCNNPIDLSCEQ